MTREETQQSRQKVMVTQQSEENVNIIASQRVVNIKNAQCQARGERTVEQDNNLVCLSRGATQVIRNKGDYNLRNRKENNTVALSKDELKEIMDSIFK